MWDNDVAKLINQEQFWTSNTITCFAYRNRLKAQDGLLYQRRVILCLFCSPATEAAA